MAGSVPSPAMARSSVKVGVGAITSVNAVEGQNRTRVVLNLVKPAAYTSTSDNRSYTITVENPVGAVAGTQAAKTTRFASASPIPLPTYTRPSWVLPW